MLKMATFIYALLLLAWRGKSAPVGSSESDVELRTLENTTVSSTAIISPTTNCSLYSVKSDRKTLELLIQSNALLINIKLQIQSYPTDFLRQKLRGFLNPYFWVYSTGETGTSLLLWENTIWSLMQPHTNLGEYEMNTTLYDNPPGCLMTLSTNDTLLVISKLILNGFNTLDSNLKDTVCYKAIKEDKVGYASFAYNCCQNNVNDDVICAETTPNWWLNIVIWLYIPTFVLLLFYSPAILIYFLEMGICTTHDCKIFKDSSLNVGDNVQILLLDPREEKESIASKDKIPVVQIKSQRLLSRDTVPVELKSMLYNLFTCRFHYRNSKEKSEEKSEDNSKISNRLCDDEFGCCKLKIYHCLQLFPKAIILFIFPLPVFFMFLNYFSEETDWNEREQLAKELNYRWSARPKTRFSTMAAVSITCLGVFYSFVLVNMLTCGILWTHTKPLFNRTFQSTVNKNRQRAKKWIKKWLKWGKEKCRWWFVPYICLTSFWIIIAKMNVCPLALLFCHLIQGRREQNKCWTVLMILITLSVLFGLATWVLFVVYLFFFTVIGIIIYAELTMKILSGVTLLTLYGWSIFHKVRQEYMNYHSKVFNLLMKKQKDSTYQAFKERRQQQQNKHKKEDNKKEQAPSYYQDLSYIVFVLPENASAVPLRPTDSASAVPLRPTDSASAVPLRPTDRNCHPCSMILDFFLKFPERLSSLAHRCRTKTRNQKTQEQISKSPYERLPQEDSTAKKSFLKFKGMFLLIDTDGTPFIPLDFFYQMIKIDSCLAPGKIEEKYYDAFVRYLKIVLFLVVVFVIVMAFSDKYGFSLTNQLLATMAAGFIPRIIELLKRDQTKVEQEDEKFEDKLVEAIKMYQDTFPIMTLEQSEETTHCCWYLPLRWTTQNTQRFQVNSSIDLLLASEDSPHI